MEKHPWMDIDTVLLEFGETKRKAINEYRRFVKEGMEHGHDPMLSGGGLIRSLGGWSQVLAFRRKNQQQETDERILGSGEFVQAVLKEAEERHLRQFKMRRDGRTIGKVIEEECAKAGVSPRELMRGSRRSAVSRVRAEIAYRSRDEIGISSAEIARHLGVATSSITRTIERMDEKGRAMQRNAT
ncbi:MAG: helix-turn-helix domain-containing protein [Nitrospirota bacterium]